MSQRGYIYTLLQTKIGILSPFGCKFTKNILNEGLFCKMEITKIHNNVLLILKTKDRRDFPLRP